MDESATIHYLIEKSYSTDFGPIMDSNRVWRNMYQAILEVKVLQGDQSQHKMNNREAGQGTKPQLTVLLAHNWVEVVQSSPIKRMLGKNHVSNQNHDIAGTLNKHDCQWSSVIVLTGKWVYKKLPYKTTTVSIATK